MSFLIAVLIVFLFRDLRMNLPHLAFLFVFIFTYTTYCAFLHYNNFLLINLRYVNYGKLFYSIYESLSQVIASSTDMYDPEAFII